MEKVLLFQIQDREAAAIADMLAAMKIRCERISVHAYRQTIGELASGKTEKPAEAYRGEAPKESMIVFCDVGEKHFNRALTLLRSQAIRIDYKAVLTPTNKDWNVLRLYAELAREKAEYERMRG